eukprot:scaffold1.g5736.t1
MVLPVVDGAGLLALEAADADVPPAVAAKIVAALRAGGGAFQLVNHGLPAELSAGAEAAARAFFALPREAKEAVARAADNTFGWTDRELTKQVVDVKQVFDFTRTPCPGLPDDHPANRTVDGFNRWPAGLPGFREALTAYYSQLERAALKLVDALAVGLGVPPARLRGLFSGDTPSLLRLNWYPPLDAGAGGGGGGGGAPPMGVRHHTDPGFLTILAQDPDTPGLQVLRQPQGWVTVAPIPGALTINVGDMAAVALNAAVPAPLHRVAASAPGGPGRYSAAYFLLPRRDAVVAPAPELVDAARPAAYRPVAFGEFWKARVDGNYADLGEEVQYDTDVTTWSPQGRIFQIEYAMEASKDFAVLATLKRAPSELSSYQRKVFKIDDHMGIAISGLTADGRILCRYMRNEFVYESPMPLGRLVRQLADRAQVGTQRSWKRPYGVGLIVAGYDESGARVFYNCPSGNYYDYKAFAMGARSQAAKTYLERQFEGFEGLPLDDLVTHALQALQASLQVHAALWCATRHARPIKEEEAPAAAEAGMEEEAPAAAEGEEAAPAEQQGGEGEGGEGGAAPMEQ